MNMEKKCGNCKSYWNSECHNRELKSMVGISAEDEFTYLTEEGHLSEYIKENDSKAYELADIVLNKLKDTDYIKKNKKEINSYKDVDTHEEFLNEFVEIMDDMISSFVIPKLKDTEVSFEIDSDFCCKFWE